MLGIKIGGGYYEYTVRVKESGFKESLGEIRKRFNLPEGSFMHLFEQGKTNRTLSDDYENKDQALPTEKVIKIFKEDMYKGIGID